MRRILRVFYPFLLSALFAPYLLAQTEPFTDSGLPGPMSPLDGGLAVEAASLHAQSLDDAPANVTIVTAEEIRRYCYRTLVEVISWVTGFYVSNDRAYNYVGVRGLLLPCDYNTRFLVMINGHNMTENVFGSNNFVGQDFALDLDLVKRIEIIRGPSSTLYGTNGILAIINVVTRNPVEQSRATVSTEVSSIGDRKLFGNLTLDLGHGINLLVAGSAFRSAGQDLYFREFDAPETNFGWSRGVDGEHAYHGFLSVVYGHWSVTTLLGRRQKWDPTAPYSTIFNAKTASWQDERGFAEIGYLKETARATWRWRFYYDHYRYNGRWVAIERGGPEDNRDLAVGTYAGTQLSWRRDFGNAWGALTLGGEATGAIHSLQKNFDVSPIARQVQDTDDPDRGAAVLLQHELPLGKRLSAQWGLRFDEMTGKLHSLSSRGSLIYRQSKRTTWKLLYGRAFRNPTSYERFYDNGEAQIGNYGLLPETADTLEIAAERHLYRRLTLTGSVYRYHIHDMITAVPVSDTTYQFQNWGGVRARGVDLELSGKFWRSLEGQASVSVQRSTDQETGLVLPNAPTVLYKAKLGAPVSKWLFITGGLQHVGERETRSALTVRPYSKVDVTLSSNRLNRNYEIATGVRNLLGQRYYDPAGYGHVMEAIRQDGRSVFLKITWLTSD